MGGFLTGFLKNRKRERLRSARFPDEWLCILKARVPLFHRLNEVDQVELMWRIQVFVREKQFEGCGGLEMSDELRVTIAGHGCLLLLHRDVDFYPLLYSVLVYPSAFLVPVNQQSDEIGGVVHEGSDLLCGEAWPTGAIVLAWDEVCRASSDDHDGTNVAIHEFAHLLDMEGGAADGTPILGNSDDYSRWAEVLSAEYRHLRRANRRGRRTVLDQYGTEDPAEFFAVVTETFFENPIEMKLRHPSLYQTLMAFYRQDPSRWRSGVDRRTIS